MRPKRFRLAALALAAALLIAPAVLADVTEADNLRAQGWYKEAIAKYEAVLKTDPESGPALYGISVSYTMLGLREKGTASLDRAGPYLEQLVAKHKDNAEYRFFRGYWAFTLSSRKADQKDKLLGLAETEIKAAVEKKKEDRYMGTLGQVYQARGKFADAQFIFGALANKYPAYHWYHFWLGQCETALKNESAAVEAYLKALKASPQFTSVYEPLRLVFSRLRKEGKQKEAVALLRRITACNPHPWVHGWVLWELAGNLSDLGDYQGAITALKKAESVQPTEAMFSNTLALNYLTLGQHDAAVDALRRAGGKNPKLLYCWENLGFTLASLGKASQARDAFRKGLTNARDVAANSPRADLKAEADLYKSLFVYYLDQLEENQE